MMTPSAGGEGRPSRHGARKGRLSRDGLLLRWHYGNQREYIDWLVRNCAAKTTKPAELIDDAAIDLLAAKLRTPLHIEQHLSLAFEKAFRVGEKPVTAEVIEAVLSRQIDDLEPKLMRQARAMTSASSPASPTPNQQKSDNSSKARSTPTAPGSLRIRCWRRASAVTAVPLRTVCRNAGRRR